jgi:putative transposase
MGKKKKNADIIGDDVIVDTVINDLTTYKTFTFLDHNPLHLVQFNYLAKISRNIYNSSIYCIQIFNKFKYLLFKKLYFTINDDTSIDTSLFINNKLLEYHKMYSNINQYIKSNNNYIYSNIMKEIKITKLVIKTSNINLVISYFINKFYTDTNIYLDNQNNKLLLDVIVTSIIRSLYRRIYSKMKNEMLGHKPFTYYNQDIYNDIQSNRVLFWNTKNKYKELIEKKLKIKLHSDQNYVGRLVYATLGNNYGKIDSTMIGYIISKAFQSYNSYYSLLSKGIKANQPKFLDKNSTYTLTFFGSKISVENDSTYKLFSGKYMMDNFKKICGSKYVKLDKNKYVKKKYMNKITENTKKKNNYMHNKKYINKKNKNIINSKYININIPKEVQDKKIKMIEIVFQNNVPKICITYECEKKIIQEANNNYEAAISIDLGMGNLMTIYDPTGSQKIITGKNISSLNRHYNKKISSAQKRNNINLVNKLNLKRTNKITHYFNQIVKWLEITYPNKKEIIIGYNKDWKNGCNMGKKQNRLFYGIPYCKLLHKIEYKLADKQIIKIEESYTSKCDSFSLERLCKKEIYSGERLKRGLYSSSKKVLINADINGAINIMRKKYNLTEIKGEEILNPRRIKI